MSVLACDHMNLYDTIAVLGFLVIILVAFGVLMWWSDR
jgi:hypothetical protein